MLAKNLDLTHRPWVWAEELWDGLTKLDVFAERKFINLHDDFCVLSALERVFQHPRLFSSSVMHSAENNFVKSNSLKHISFSVSRSSAVPPTWTSSPFRVGCSLGIFRRQQ